MNQSVAGGRVRGAGAVVNLANAAQGLDVGVVGMLSYLVSHIRTSAGLGRLLHGNALTADSGSMKKNAAAQSSVVMNLREAAARSVITAAEILPQ